MSRVPVTTDHAVLTAMVESETKAFTAKQIGKLLDLTPFQITARLKGMESRELIVRNGQTNTVGKKLWIVTDEGRVFQKDPPPPPAIRMSRSRYGGSNPPPARPDDSDIPRVTRSRLNEGWKCEMLDVDGHTHDLITNPSGVQFVCASHLETANLIFEPNIVGLKPARYKLYEGSDLQKRRESWVHTAAYFKERMKYGKSK